MIKISEMASAGALGDTDLLEVVQAGSNRKMTGLQVKQAAPVQSVNGGTGDVVLNASSVGAEPAGAVQGHFSSVDHLTAQEAAAAAPVQTVNGRTGNVQTGGVVAISTSATLTPAHQDAFLYATGPITLTIDAGSFPDSCEIHIAQAGAGAVTIEAGTGVTLLKPATQSATIREQYGVVSLKLVGTDTWLLFGALGDV